MTREDTERWARGLAEVAGSPTHTGGAFRRHSGPGGCPDAARQVGRQVPSLRKLFADSAYQRSVFHKGAAIMLPQLAINIVKRSH
jgi:hypothetical protein